METVLGSAFVLWFVAAIFLGAMAIFWPLMAWSVMRNIKQARRQLERLNDSIEGGKVNITFTITDRTSQGEGLRRVAGAGAGPLKL